MTCEKREIVICVDMGMTGTVAKWQDSKSKRGWNSHSDKKIPTRLAYDLQDNKGPPIAWGSECDGLSPQQVKECFKSYIGAKTFPKELNTMPWQPTSKQELHRWVRDYLTVFCTDIAHCIDTKAGPSWRDATVIWNFTVPGNWRDPVALDFKRLAKDAVIPCFPNAKNLCITTNIIEAEASALFLLAESSINDKKYSVGNTVISCDIGGATTDVAISRVSSAAKLITLHQLDVEPVGTVTIEKAFWLHARHTFQSAGAQNPSQLALETVCSSSFRHTREKFMASRSKDPIVMRLPQSCHMLDWSPLETSSTSLSTIKNGWLYIHRKEFESFFEELVEHIEVTVDKAIHMAAKTGISPSTIGFCGGGSRAPYMMKRLEGRWNNIPISRVENEPEMATIKGSQLIWDQARLWDFATQARFGLETDKCIKWRTPEESFEPSDFKKVYSWIVQFDCSQGSRNKKHRIIVITTAHPLPTNYSDVLRLPNSKSWIIKADLEKEKASYMGLGDWNFQILCKIARPWEIAFEAKSLATGRMINLWIKEESRI